MTNRIPEWDKWENLPKGHKCKVSSAQHGFVARAKDGTFYYRYNQFIGLGHRYWTWKNKSWMFVRDDDAMGQLVIDAIFDAAEVCEEKKP